MIDPRSNGLRRLNDLLNDLLPWRHSHPDLTPIVPQSDVRGTTLAVVITIMSFLAALALNGVNVIAIAAQDWTGQISREATIQIRSLPQQDMQQALAQTVDLVETFPGIAEVRILEAEETFEMLKPWLGQMVDWDDLPIPRLMSVKFEADFLPDVESLRALLQQNVPGSSLDDHHIWIDRLGSMAHSMVFFGIGIFCLILTAMVLTVVFATRSTLLNNAHIVEVLHFIGADSRFVARQFDGHFLRTGLKGAACGGGAALLLFWLVQIGSQRGWATPEGVQFSMFFGSFSFNLLHAVEVIVLVFFVAFLTMQTSRVCVLRQLREIDQREADFLNRLSSKKL